MSFKSKGEDFAGVFQTSFVMDSVDVRCSYFSLLVWRPEKEGATEEDGSTPREEHETRSLSSQHSLDNSGDRNSLKRGDSQHSISSIGSTEEKHKIPRSSMYLQSCSLILPSCLYSSEGVL